MGLTITDLKEIGNLLDNKLEASLKPIRDNQSQFQNQIKWLSLKLETLDNSMSAMDIRIEKRFNNVEEKLDALCSMYLRHDEQLGNS